MSFLDALPAFLAAHAVLSYAALFALSFAETVIGLGFFIYGELIFLPAAALAGAGVLNIWLVSLALITGGVMGDVTSFCIGRRYGAGFLARRKGEWARLVEEKGTAFFRRYGAKAVFFARFLGPVSWITPFFAGMYGVSFRSFISFNIPGAALGIGQFIIIGYFFGAAYKSLLPELKLYGNVVIGAIIAFVAVYHLYRYLRGRSAR